MARRACFNLWPAVLLWWLASAGTATAQGTVTAPVDALQPIQTAPVIVDGVLLMRLRGVTSYPAEERARITRERILQAARDEQLDPADLQAVALPDRTIIRLGDRDLVVLVQADADHEQIALQLLAEVILEKTRAAIVKYRDDRSSEALKVSGLYFVGLTAGLCVLVWLIVRIRGWTQRQLDTRIAISARQLERKSRKILRSGDLLRAVRGLVGMLFVLAYLLIGYFYLNSVLGAFPWTRSFAGALLELISRPLVSMAASIAGALPNLVFLAILFLVVRFVLRALLAFFSSVERGQIVMRNFDPDWGMPTYRIVRVLVVAFAVVVAYPYIPGSDSAAFKGVSLFLGVVVSLGSTSFIANMIAGLTMTYRGAYREGDWVRIGDEEGQVLEMRMMVMRLRTRKKETVTIPNSVILNTSVTNYSASGRNEGLLLHTEVSIGYDVPWRRVEALLTEAAGRTEGVLQDPAPFVLQKRLGDFAVTYELNILVKAPERMPQLYSELHRNIQDVFSEHAVQIMSPAYVADPAEPKIAPPEADRQVQ